jgi:thioredoxin reductase (NADPH)
MDQNGLQPTYEVAIVGAGPIGLELAVALKEQNVNYIHFEAKQIGYTMSWWPRQTPFFSTSERIAIARVPIQSIHQGRTTGEEYLAYLRMIVEMFDLQVNTYEKVLGIERDMSGFTLRTATLSGERTYRARRVVLAKGDMDQPNWLGIPGETLPHVTHYFDDPHPYFRKRLLVVGGKNSAVETALRCWRSGAEVALSYRRAELNERVKDHLRPDLLAQIENGNIKYYPETIPIEITPGYVVLQPLSGGQPAGAEPMVHPTDFVVLATGFRADMSLYEMAGVKLGGLRRAPQHDPATMETNVAGLYLAGTTAAGEHQERYRIFIENSHEHVAKIVQHLTGQRPSRLGSIPARHYELALAQFEAN